MTTASPLHAFRGTLVDFIGDPHDLGDAACRHVEDGLLLVRDGRVEKAGPARELLPTLAPQTLLTDYSGHLILPGFVDTHIHYSQTDVIASYGEQLLVMAGELHVSARAGIRGSRARPRGGQFFVQELLRNGTTTAMVFATVHRASVDAIFEAAAAQDLCLVAGKVMMDRNCPEFLRDTPASSL